MLREEKPALRLLLRARRVSAAQADPMAAEALASLFSSSLKLPEGAIVSSYLAQEAEMNPAPLEEWLRTHGHEIVLPCLTARAASLAFRSYVPGDALAPGLAGIPEPLADAPEKEPDVLLVPLLGFDESLTRLGQGGGYYDRTLEKLRARRGVWAIGLAYEAQACAILPLDPFDEKLDLVVTEKRIIGQAP